MVMEDMVGRMKPANDILSTSVLSNQRDGVCSPGFQSCEAVRFVPGSASVLPQIVGPNEDELVLSRPNPVPLTTPQGTFAVTPEINVTAGGRRTRSKRKGQVAGTPTQFSLINGIPLPIVIRDAEPAPSSRITSVGPSGNTWTYTLSADWKPTHDILVYVINRAGFKPGNINSNAPPGIDRFYGPEKLKDWEIGLKADWQLGGVTARTNIAVNSDKYQDIQRTTLVPPATTLTRNVAGAEFNGVEFEGGVHLTDWFEISGCLSYQDAKYTNWVETVRCASDFFRPQCAGLPATATLTFDGAKGPVTNPNGCVTNFTPNRIGGVSKWTWMISPVFHLELLTGQDIPHSATINRRSKLAAVDNNNEQFAGIARHDHVPAHLYRRDLQPHHPAGFHADRPARRLAMDQRLPPERFRLRHECREQYRGHRPERAAQHHRVTPAVVNEPRMFGVGITYEF
jgi:hypothetical protein